MFGLFSRGPAAEVFTMADVREQAAVLALVEKSPHLWSDVATLIESCGSALRLVRRDWSGFEPLELQEAKQLGDVTDADLDRYEQLIAECAADGIALLTVLDAGYPRNLRQVYNRPPFLFVRGRVLPDDERAIAVVGTRRPSERGLAQAATLARELAERGVTVLSGLALGIDGAAHEATLDAGGRTIAVMGTGIRRIYPRQHEALAGRILDEGGALVSQFWPDGPPTKYSFPMRNAVMSGMAIGTVVVEASSTSGARMQARLALEHGKLLFLVKDLVMQESWARRYAEHPATTVVEDVEDVVDVLSAATRPVEQLTLG
jgi:DNA processing protein